MTKAQHLNISRKTLSKVLNGRGAITPEMAVRLEIAFSSPSAEHWMTLQSACDLWQLRAPDFSGTSVTFAV